jgi:hypothetical protein
MINLAVFEKKFCLTDEFKFNLKKPYLLELFSVGGKGTNICLRPAMIARKLSTVSWAMECLVRFGHTDIKLLGPKKKSVWDVPKIPLLGNSISVYTVFRGWQGKEGLKETNDFLSL